jgi:hypothetical protein
MSLNIDPSDGDFAREVNVSWIKKAVGVAAVLGGTGLFACSGTNQVVGSDGRPVKAGGSAGESNAGSGGHGPTIVSQAAPVSELSYEIVQIALSSGIDDAPPCMPIELPIDAETGNAACNVLSMRQSADCSCAEAGYSPVSEELSRVARLQMQLTGQCSPSIGVGLHDVPCDEVCVCKVDPAVGTSLQKCQSEAEPDASTTGWCYVSDAGDSAQKALVENCFGDQKHALRFFGPITGHEPPEQQPWLFLGCPFPKPVKALGEPCISDDEYNPKFSSFGVREINIDDDAAGCETKICLQNHFQGRASCPYGQATRGGNCLVAGGNVPVAQTVRPQLLARPAETASICSCHCAGPGPGPYCTCPESMQCEPMLEALGFGTDYLAGSYCIPAGTQYDRNGDTTECSGDSCGFGHYYH